MGGGLEEEDGPPSMTLSVNKIKTTTDGHVRLFLAHRVSSLFSLLNELQWAAARITTRLQVFRVFTFFLTVSLISPPPPLCLPLSSLLFIVEEEEEKHQGLILYIVVAIVDPAAAATAPKRGIKCDTNQRITRETTFTLVQFRVLFCSLPRHLKIIISVPSSTRYKNNNS